MEIHFVFVYSGVKSVKAADGRMARFIIKLKWRYLGKWDGKKDCIYNVYSRNVKINLHYVLKQSLW